MGIAASQSCLYLDGPCRDGVVYAPTKACAIKTEVWSTFSGTWWKVKPQFISQGSLLYQKWLKTRTVQRVVFCMQISFFCNWLCALLNAEDMSLKLFTQPCLRSKLANCFSIALIQNAFSDRNSHICFSEPTQPLTKFYVQVCTHFPEWFMNHCAFLYSNSL